MSSPPSTGGSGGGGGGGNTPVNRPPVFSNLSVTLRIAEGVGAGDPVDSPVTAIDPDNDRIVYILGGRDEDAVCH